MSEMTTAEMVEWCKASAAKEPNPMAAMCFTEIAARLSALDKELTAATARAEKAEAELQILRGVPVSIDTPHEVCDGIVSAPLAQIIADYGVEALAWIMDASQERADYETWSSRCVKAEALYAKAWEECKLARSGWETESLMWDANQQRLAAPELPVAWEEAERAHNAARREVGL
jgi:hypothetical protein